MKKIFCCLLFWSGYAIAQNRNPTYFDKFTKDAAIEWAGWRVDSFHFTNVNLSELLRKKYDQDKIKVCLENGLSAYAPCCMHYASKCQVKWGTHCGNGIPITDSLGNIVKKTKAEKKEEDEYIPETDFTDSSIFNVLDIPQLLYIENNKLKAFIPYVITKRLVTITGSKSRSCLSFCSKL